MFPSAACFAVSYSVEKKRSKKRGGREVYIDGDRIGESLSGLKC